MSTQGHCYTSIHTSKHNHNQQHAPPITHPTTTNKMHHHHPKTYHLLLFHRTQRQPSQRFHDRLCRQDHRFFIFPFASFLFRRSRCFGRGFLLRFLLFFWWIVLFLFRFLHFFYSSGSFLFGLTPCGTKNKQRRINQNAINKSECQSRSMYK